MQFFYQFPHKVERLALVSSGGLGQEVSPLLRGAALPGRGRPRLGRFAPERPRRARRDRRRPRQGSAGARPSTSRRSPARFARFRIPGSRQAFLQSLRSVIDIHGQKVSAVDRLYLLGPVETLIVWGERDRTIPIQHGDRRARADPALAHGDAAARRALPEPRGSGRPRRRPRPLARRDEAVSPQRGGLVRADRLEAGPRPSSARGVERLSLAIQLRLRRAGECHPRGFAQFRCTKCDSGHRSNSPESHAAPWGREESSTYMSNQSFADLGVSAPVRNVLAKRGITEPFAVQKLVIGDALAGRDVLVKSPNRVGQDACLLRSDRRAAWPESTSRLGARRRSHPRARASDR